VNNYNFIFLPTTGNAVSMEARYDILAYGCKALSTEGNYDICYIMVTVSTL